MTCTCDRAALSKGNPMRSSPGLAGLLLVALACGTEPAGKGEVVLDADTLLTTGSESVGRPIDLAVTPDGEVLLADMGRNQLVLFDTAGVERRAIGREGSGPLEFGIPRSLHVAGDSVRLVDVANARLMIFNLAGDFARTIPGPPGTANAGVAFNGRGEALVARNGRDSALLQRVFPDGALGARLGTPRVPETEVWDFTRIKADLAAGRVPQVLRNETLPALAEDGSAWALLFAEGEIERYSAADSLLWRWALPDTIAVRLREALFEANRADTVPFRFTFPNVIAAAQPRGDTLWALLREPDGHPATLLVLGPDGTILRRVSVPGAAGARAFAFAPDGRTIYLLDSKEGTVVRARLPAGGS